MTDLLPPAGPRMLPALSDANRAFWTSGRTGRLMAYRCQDCEHWYLPPHTHCPACGGPGLAEPVSGHARVLTWTVNHQKYHPDIDPPNLIAIVVLDEQDDLLFATNLVGVEPHSMREGLAVDVRFEDHGEVLYPVFAPAEGRR